MELNPDTTAIDINKRQTKLLELNSYIQSVDHDVTMILQSLQWDRKHLLQASPMVSCRHDRNHRMPPDKLENHEKKCYLRSLGYTEEDLLLPEPLDAKASTLVTLNKNDIQHVIEYAVKVDPAFKKGRGISKEPGEPLSLERLRHAYSTDERRAIHDAVVTAAPSCHDLSELALLGGDGDKQNTKPKSRAEIIAELRDMKRRRTKYRGAATRNYSDELRTVIATQMELYCEALGVTKNNSNYNKSNIEKSNDFRNIQIKKEPLESDKEYISDKERSRNSSRSDRHRGRNEESLHKYKYNDEVHRSDKYNDGSRRSDKYSDEGRRRDKYNDEVRRSDKHNDETRRSDKYNDEVRRSDKYNDETRRSDKYNDEVRRRDKYNDETRQQNYRKEICNSDIYSERAKIYANYKRDRDDNGHKDNRDRYSSSSKERVHEYKKKDKYRDDYKDYKTSRSSEGYKITHGSREKYTEGNHKRYYDCNQEYEITKKRIKREKD